MPLETRPFDAAEHLDSPEAEAWFIQDAVETGDAAFVANAVGVVAKARGLTDMARDLGLPRRELMEALFGFSGPDMAVLLDYARKLGVQVEPPIKSAAEAA